MPALLLLLLPALVAGTRGMGEPAGTAGTAGVAEVAGSLDSTSILAEAREAQARFERARVYHAPWGWWGGGVACDERVGRFCLRYSSDQEGDPTPPWTPPEEPEPVVAARAALDSALTQAAIRLPGDAWIAGQRTWYRGDAGDWDGALVAARGCRSPEPGWCDLLVGYALHHGGRAREAAEALERGVEALPAATRYAWNDLEPLVEREVGQALRLLEGAEREVLEARIWALGNPLFLVPGNALRSEHLARHVAARIQSEARNPHAIRWGDDMTEILVRFGPEIGYERLRDTGIGVSMGPPPVSGRFSSVAKGVFPTLEGILQTTTAGPEAFPPAVYGARSRHAPPTVPRIRDLRVQVARLVRGDSLLVAAAWRLPDPPGWDSVPPLRVDSVGVFILSETGVTPERIELTPSPGALGGVMQARVPLGPWWISVEALDSEGGRGWRHRQGVSRPPPRPGELEFSDLVLLGPEASSPDGAPPPGQDRLEAHLHRMLPTDTLGADARVEVAWEVYGSPTNPDDLLFRVRVGREERGWLRRAGEALGVLSPVEPVEIRWEAGLAPGSPEGLAAPVATGLHFRRVELDLEALDPGVWQIEIVLETRASGTPDRTPAAAGPAPPGARARLVVVDR